jgi:hypothetical protein
MSTRPGDLRLTFRERLLRRITVDLDGPCPVDEAPCWTWTGKTAKAGYGTYRDQLAHRLVYEELSAPIPDGLELDHLCRNPPCVNPAHLEPVTHPVNCQRSSAGEVNRARMLAQTHCARRHEFTPENTKQTSRQRKCRQCIREDSAAARARRKATA